MSKTEPHLPRMRMLALLLAVTASSISHAAGAASAAPSTLVDAARLWSAVKYTHPALADGRIDWDLALVDALPALLAARDLPASGAVVARLMAPLADPSLRIYHTYGPDQVKSSAGQPQLEWLPQDVALAHLHAPDPIDLAHFKDLGRARAVILDIRRASGRRRYDWEASLHALLATLIVQPLTLPAVRYRLASGPRPMSAGWEGLVGGFITTEANRLLPARGATARRLVFIVNDSEAVPRAVLALQRAGLAQVVAEQGAATLRSGPLQSVWMSGMTVEFSAGELVTPEGRIGVAPTLTLPADRSTGPASAPVGAAAKLLAEPMPAAAATVTEPLSFAVRHDEPRYRDMHFPARLRGPHAGGEGRAGLRTRAGRHGFHAR